MAADFLSPNIFRQSEKEEEENKSVSKMCHSECQCSMMAVKQNITFRWCSAIFYNKRNILPSNGAACTVHYWYL